MVTIQNILGSITPPSTKRTVEHRSHVGVDQNFPIVQLKSLASVAVDVEGVRIFAWQGGPGKTMALLPA